MRYIWQHPHWPNFTWQRDRLLDALSKARFTQGKLSSKVSRTTGFREISDMVKKGILLQNEAKGRSVSYDIRWKE